MDAKQFFDMQYGLGDILIIVGYIGGLIGVYVVIISRLTRTEIRQDAIRELLASLRTEVEKNKADIDREMRSAVDKLVRIEAGQVKTNTFLEENLKNLTRIIAMHETEIERIKDKLDKINTNTSVK